MACYFILTGLFLACTPSAKTSKSIGYEEDLSVHRPKYDLTGNSNSETAVSDLPDRSNVEPKYHIKSELDSVLSAMILSKKNIKHINGYSIQVYSGNNRSKAAEVKKVVTNISEDFEPKISYNQPNYKVKVGKYFSRIEANRDLVALKNKFRQALLVPDKILIE
jgi:hypothetical protein